MLKHVLFTIIFVVVHIIYLSFSESSKTYGEFSLKMTNFEVCRGPKRADCCKLTATIQNDTHLIVKLEVLKNVIPNRGKIVSMVNNKPLVRLQMKKPCDHLFMKPLFQAVFNTTQNCEFKKGDHLITVDLEEVAQKYYGGMFLYGNMSFKSLFYNDECNFSCSIAEVTFFPKKEAKKNN